MALFIALLVIAVILGNVLRTLINFLPPAGLANGITGALIGLVIGCVFLSGVFTGLQKKSLSAALTKESKVQPWAPSLPTASTW